MSDWSGLSRRGFLRAGAIGVAGVAGAALIGCTGDDDDDAPAPAATQAPAAATATPAAATAEPTPTPTEAPAGPKSGGTLVWAMESWIGNSDPHSVGNWVTHRTKDQMADKLIEADLTVPPHTRQADYTDPLQPIVMKLAESMEVSDDGTEFTFKLRRGAKFHDGTDVNAEAVNRNYDRFWREDSDISFTQVSGWGHPQLHQHTDRVEVVDDYTIKMVNNRFFPDFLNLWTQSIFGNYICSPTQVEKVGNEEFANAPVASGPFKFNERVEDERLVFDRNEDYWGDKAFLDRLIMIPRGEPATRVTALQTGEADIIWVVPPDSIPQLLDQGFKVVQGLVPHIWWISMNPRNESFQDLRVRQALQHGMDRPGIATDLLRDTVIPAYGPNVPGQPAFDPDYVSYAYDPAEAKKLLSAAGVESIEDTWWFPSAGSGNLLPVQMAQWMQSKYAEIGFNMGAEIVEWNAFGSMWPDLYTDGATASGSWGMAVNWWGNVFGLNVGVWNSMPEAIGDEALDILDRAQFETDPDAANELYRDANRIIMDQAYALPVVHDSAPIGMRDEVQGFVHVAAQWNDFSVVWLEDA